MEILFFILQLLIFTLLVIACFISPGIYLLNRSKISLNPWEKSVLSTVIGFSIFTLLGYLLIALGLKIIIFPIILITLYFNYQSLKELLKSLRFSLNKKALLLITFFSLGVLGQLLVIFPSGLKLNGEIVFYSSHGHDAMWHIALTNELMKGYPIQSPNISESKLINYHFFSDIAPAYFTYYLKLDPLHLYSRLFPLLFSILLGATAFFAAFRISKSYLAGFWSMIIVYFAGSFGYIVTYLKDKTIGGESIFWASQTQSSIGNPPQIISLIIFLTFLILFQSFLRNGIKDKYLSLILIILAGTLVEFKVYGGVILLLSLGLISFWEIITRRNYSTFILTFLSGILSLGIYLPNSAASVGFLIFEPWWYIRTMVVVPDRLNLLEWEHRRQTYLSENNLKRVYQLEIQSFLIFLLGNLGIRSLAIWQIFTNLKHILKDSYFFLLIVLSLLSLILPLLFLQKGVASNTIQFIQYFLLISGIFSAITISKILNKIPSVFGKILISSALLLIMIPTQASLIYSFYQRPPITKIDKFDHEALTYIKSNASPNSNILSPGYNRYLNLKLSTPPIWGWFDTSYISAMTNTHTYFSDFEQADIMGYPIADRQHFQDQIFKETSPIIFTQELKNKKIDYLYFPKIVPPAVDLTKTDLRKVFENSEYEVWKTI